MYLRFYKILQQWISTNLCKKTHIVMSFERTNPSNCNMQHNQHSDSLEDLGHVCEQTIYFSFISPQNRYLPLSPNLQNYNNRKQDINTELTTRRQNKH
jgi:hypothetical protein